MTPPSEMVVRVARAICLAESCHDGVAMHHLEAARAAIEAITTPSDSELDHLGRAALCGWNNVDPDNETMAAEWERMGPATREAWMRAMRRAVAALKVRQ